MNQNPGSTPAADYYRTRDCTVEELIARLQKVASEYPGRKIILAKDGEGNEHSPLACVAVAIYHPDSIWSGHLVREDGDEKPEQFNAIVLSPII